MLVWTCIALSHMLLPRLRKGLTEKLFNHTERERERETSTSTNLPPVQLIYLEERFPRHLLQYVSAQLKDLMSVVKLSIGKPHGDI